MNYRNSSYKKYYILLVLAVFFIVQFSFTAQNRVLGMQPVTEIQKKLEGISGEAKKVLETLFTLEQEIKGMETEEVRLSGEINNLQIEIRDLEILLSNCQKNYDEQLEILKKVLSGFQRNGPVSYLDTLLSAEDLRTFIHSFNIIRMLTRNVGELLSTIEEGKKDLAEKKARLSGSLAALETKKMSLSEALARKLKLKEEQENYLKSLGEDRKQYEEQLNNVNKMWADIKVLFSEIISEFTKIINEGNISMEDMNLSIEFPAIKGKLYAETLNKIIREHSDLTEIRFTFHPDKVVIEVPEKRLALSGIFTMKENSVVQLDISEGSFYGMPLNSASIKELFRNGYMLIDFKEIAGNMVEFDFTLKSISTYEGYMEFRITLKLF